MQGFRMSSPNSTAFRHYKPLRSGLPWGLEGLHAHVDLRLMRSVQRLAAGRISPLPFIVDPFARSASPILNSSILCPDFIRDQPSGKFSATRPRLGWQVWIAIFW